MTLLLRTGKRPDTNLGQKCQGPKDGEPHARDIIPKIQCSCIFSSMKIHLYRVGEILLVIL